MRIIDNLISSEIDDSEFLYRGIVDLHWDKEKKRVSSAAYKNPGGLSVDRDGGRDDNTCISRLSENITFQFISKLLTRAVRAKDLLVIHKPISDNPYHSEIHQNKDTVELTRGQARYLNSIAEIVFSRNEQ